MAGDPTPVFQDNVQVAKSNARAALVHRVGTLDEVRDTNFAGVWLIFVSETKKIYERDTGDTTSADDDGETTIVGLNDERWKWVEFGGSAPGEKVARLTTVALTSLDLSTLEAGDVVNGVTLIAGDDFIATAQVDPSENGPYAVPTSGPVIRHPEYPEYDDIAGAVFSVMRGTTDGDKLWTCTSDPGGEIGTDALQFRPVDYAAPSGDLSAERLGAQIAELDAEKMPLAYLDVDPAFAADSDAKVPSQKAVKNRIDDILAIITGAQVFKGGWDASGGSFPGTTGRKTGWYYVVTVAGTVDGVSFSVGDGLYARVDDASTTTYAANWVKVEGSLTASEILAALFSAAGSDELVLRRSGSSIVFATVSTAGIANDAVTYDKLQNISAQYRVLARKSASAGNAEETTLSELLDFLGSTARGDMIVRGASTWARIAKGSQYSLLIAGADDPAWSKISALGEEGAPGSGDWLLGETAGGALVKIDVGNLPGGGGGSDLNPVWLALAKIAMKQADINNQMIDYIGFIADSFDTTTGLDVGGSTNLNTSEAGVIKPTDSGGTESSASTSGAGSATAGYTLYERSWAVDNSKTVSHIGVYSTVAGSGKLKIGNEDSATQYDELASVSFSHTGSGWENFALLSPYATPGSGTLRAGCYWASGGLQASLPWVDRSYKLGDITGNNQSGFTNDTNGAYPLRVVYQGTPNNMTAVSAAAGLPAEPNDADLIGIIWKGEAATVNTDYKAYVSIDNGANYDEVTLSEVETQGDYTVFRAVAFDVAARTGTSLRWKITTHNNKNVKFPSIAVRAY